MNIFKFRIDLYRKKPQKNNSDTSAQSAKSEASTRSTETTQSAESEASTQSAEKDIATILKELYANGLSGDKLKEFLLDKKAHSGANFQNLFSDNMLIAVGGQSSGETSFFITIEDEYPKTDHEIICIFVKTEDNNIFKQFKLVCKELKNKCKPDITVKDKNVTELYLYVCEYSDVLHPESSIMAKINSKEKDVFSILCLTLEIAIAVFFFFSWVYDYTNLFSAVSIWVTVGIPLIMEVKNWLSRKFIIDNLSQNVKKESGSSKTSTSTTSSGTIPLDTTLQPSASLLQQGAAATTSKAKIEG